jgi:hypothetical protein
VGSKAHRLRAPQNALALGAIPQDARCSYSASQQQAVASSQRNKEPTMPLIRLYVPSHLSTDRIDHLANAVHSGLVSTCGVPENDRFVLVLTQPPGSMFIDPHFGQVSRSNDASVVEITFLAGRSDEQKRRLYQWVSTRAEAKGWRPDDIMVALTENQHIDWSLGRGLAFDKVEQAHD